MSVSLCLNNMEEYFCDFVNAFFHSTSPSYRPVTRILFLGSPVRCSTTIHESLNVVRGAYVLHNKLDSIQKFPSIYSFHFKAPWYGWPVSLSGNILRIATDMSMLNFIAWVTLLVILLVNNCLHHIRTVGCGRSLIFMNCYWAFYFINLICDELYDLILMTSATVLSFHCSGVITQHHEEFFPDSKIFNTILDQNLYCFSLAICKAIAFLFSVFTCCTS